MPTYQYQCEGCGHEFEEFQRISEDPLDTCPKCGGKAHRIITGGAGFLLKGSGFYTTDYRGDSYKKEAEKDKSSAKPEPPKTSTPAKKDSKKSD